MGSEGEDEQQQSLLLETHPSSFDSNESFKRTGKVLITFSSTCSHLHIYILLINREEEALNWDYVGMVESC